MDGWKLAGKLYGNDDFGTLPKLRAMLPTPDRGKCRKCGANLPLRGKCIQCEAYARASRTNEARERLLVAHQFPLGTEARRRGSIDMQELALRSQTAMAEVRDQQFWTKDRVALVKSQIMPGSSDGELQLFLQTCQVSGLNPFATPRQVWAVQYGGKWQAVVAIDGLRSQKLSDGTISYIDGPYWCGPDGKWVDVWVAPRFPVAAKVTIHLTNGGTVQGVAHWDTYSRQQGTNKSTWGTGDTKAYGAGAHMLGKCAEAQALKRVPGSLPFGAAVSVEDTPVLTNGEDAPLEAELADPETGEIVEPEVDRKALTADIKRLAGELGVGAEQFRELLHAEYNALRLSELDGEQLADLVERLERRRANVGEAGGEG